MREPFGWGTHKESPQIRNVFNPHKNFPGRHLMPRHAKAWKLKRPVSQNEEPFYTENLFV